MYQNAIALILADNKRMEMGELTRHRPLSAIPFAGRYRIIDFMLSNIVNTGITSVGIMTYSKYRSLMDHIQTGRAWDLDRKNQGLVMLPPYANAENSLTQYNAGNADLINALNFCRDSKGKYIVVSDCSTTFTDTLDSFIQKHEESNAVISFLYNRVNVAPGGNYLVMETGRNNRLKAIYSRPEKPVGNKVSMGVLVMEKRILEDMLSEAISRGESGLSIYSLLQHHNDLPVQGIEYEGFAQHTVDVGSYFANTMELLDSEKARNAFFWSGLSVYTKVKDEAPTLYSGDSKTAGSLISDGCRIYGDIRRSLLFRGVMVSKRAYLRNCIIMQDTFISENCELENVIVDKNCVIRPGIKLVGSSEHPIVIGKGTIL